MDRLHWMTVFAAVAEEKGFARAARRLGLSPAAATRAVVALEDHLKVKLLERTTRLVRPTEAGSRYLEDVRRLLTEVADAEECARGLHAEPRGELAITAPVLFGRLFVTPALVTFLERYRDVTVRAHFADRVVNLVEEGIDVGIRIGELPDSSLKAIRVGRVRRVLCAAPHYIGSHGLPQHPRELAAHRLIAASGISHGHEWKFDESGSAFALRVAPRLIVTSNDAAIEAAERGFGITRLLSYQIAPQLRTGTLKILLATYETAPLPIRVVHHEGRHASTRVRAFVDWMVDHLRADAALA